MDQVLTMRDGALVAAPEDAMRLAPTLLPR
jgi:hypothetical protein